MELYRESSMIVYIIMFDIIVAFGAIIRYTEQLLVSGPTAC